MTRTTFKADSPKKLTRYTDFNWTGAIDRQKSIDKYIWMFSRGMISYQSKKQATVALLSCEAEYMAITKARKEALWCLQFLEALRH